MNNLLHELSSSSVIKKITASADSTISMVHGASNVVFDGTFKEYLITWNCLHPSSTSEPDFLINFRDGGTDFDAPKTTTSFRCLHNEADTQELFQYYNIDLANAIKTKLSGTEVIIIENSSDDGRLYGSVTSSVIADKINEGLKGSSLKRSDVILEKPIKDIGIYHVVVEPYSDVRFSISLVVTRSQSEIESLRKAAKEAQERIKEENREIEKAAQAKKAEKVEEIAVEEEKIEETL